MTELKSKETRSFRDPMATRLAAAQARGAALAAAYPPVAEVYDGFYLHVSELTAEGERYLLGAEGIIGSALSVVVDTEGVALTAASRVLARVGGADAERLAGHVHAGWELHCYLACTFFTAQGKKGAAELAVLAWAPAVVAEVAGAGSEGAEQASTGGEADAGMRLGQPGAPAEQPAAGTGSEDAGGERSAGTGTGAAADYQAAFTQFAANIANRLAHGDRAELALSQERLIDVLESKGAWFLTPTTKRSPLPKGTVVYKSRRSGTERLTGYALAHRSGCNILALLFWLWVVAALAALVWFFFLP